MPGGAYYGVHTLRAAKDFPICGIPITAYSDLVNALAVIKQAAARTNKELGLLNQHWPMRSTRPASRYGKDVRMTGSWST